MKIDRNHLLRTFPTAASPPVDEHAGERQSRKPTLHPGQQVQGQVLARLSDQVYLVRIAGQEYRTEIPLNLRPGDPLELTFRTGEPRPSFTLRGITFQASPATISSTASRLSRVMSDIQGATTARPAITSAPLLDAPPSDAARMAASLQRALVFSGLFYESHLVRWLLGERPLAELLQEPQARFSTLRARTKGVIDRNLPAEEDGILEPPHPADRSNPGDSGADGIMEELLGPVSYLSLSIVREQLAVLLSGMVRWQGEIWPDQEMEWDVTRDGDGTEENEAPCWRTTIRLQLPRLGAVDATLALSGSGVRLELITDSPRSMDFMQQELESLDNSMSEAGLRLRETVIDCEPGR